MLYPPHDSAIDAPLNVRCARPLLAYGVPEAQEAWEGWGANCGPWALAAVLGVDLNAVRELLPAFARRPFTKETDMRDALRRAGQDWVELSHGWPSFGLVRVAWHGPWWDSPDPFARLRHSHWIATHDRVDGRWVFDGNMIAIGGWARPDFWRAVCVPDLLAACDPLATGAWRVVDRFEIVGSGLGG